MSGTPFADRLAALVEARRSQICLGLDPRADGEQGGAPTDSRERATLAGAEIAERCERLVELAGPACVAVKPQLACFERYGAAGWAALERVVAAARAAGLLVVADAKRGDVPHTAAVYAEGLLGAAPPAAAGLGADAVTVNPLLGADAIEPFLDAAQAVAGGLFVLVRTSNPGARDVFDLDTGGRPLHERLAELVAERSERLRGESGLSGVGAVVGATAPELLGRLRALMPRSIFLLPGVGAQGAAAGALGPALGEHPASILVAASRGIADAEEPDAAAMALRDEVWALSA